MESVKIIGGKRCTSSRLIARYFNKRHKNILKAISNVYCTNEFNRLNFIPIHFTDNYGRERFEYAITQDGLTLLAVSFTGRKAAKFKKHFRTEFDYLDAIIRNQQFLARGIPLPKRNFGIKTSAIYKYVKNITLEGWVALYNLASSMWERHKPII